MNLDTLNETRKLGLTTDFINDWFRHIPRSGTPPQPWSVELSLSAFLFILQLMLECRAEMHTDTAPLTEVIQPHIVPVRSLVEFVLQSGDLTSGGFQRRDRAQLGTQGHRQVQRSRPEG